MALPTRGSPQSLAKGDGDEPDDPVREALTRGLVQRGVVLLSQGRIDVTPCAAYRVNTDEGLVLVDTPEGISIVSDQRRKRDTFERGGALRVGLPERSQLQVSLPMSSGAMTRRLATAPECGTPARASATATWS